MAISIITPVYNGHPQIRRTLTSLERQSVPFEHIVMDACSKDGTREAVNEYASVYDVRLISEPDEGLYDAVSKGFARAKGDILAWVNAGDIYMPSALSLVAQVFASHPEVDWITGIPGYYHEEEDILFVGSVVPVYSRTVIRRGWHNGRWLPHLQQESMFWRRSLWDRSGGKGLLSGQGRGKGYAMDYHLWRRFARHARLHTVCSPLAAFAFTKGQISEKFRRQYYQECGVDNPPNLPLRFTRHLWAFYSVLKYSASIKRSLLKQLHSPQHFPPENLG